MASRLEVAWIGRVHLDHATLGCGWHGVIALRQGNARKWITLLVPATLRSAKVRVDDARTKSDDPECWARLNERGLCRETADPNYERRANRLERKRRLYDQLGVTYSERVVGQAITSLRALARKQKRERAPVHTDAPRIRLRA